MPMNPAEAVTWGSFVQAAYDQYASDPGQANPAAIMNMPAGYTLVRTIQMTDFARSGAVACLLRFRRGGR